MKGSAVVILDDPEDGAGFIAEAEPFAEGGVRDHQTGRGLVDD